MDIDNIIKRYYETTMDAIDAIFISVAFVWTIVEFFFKPGPIVLIPAAMAVFNLNNKNKMISRILHTTLFTLMIITTSLIILNELYIHKDEAYYNDDFNWMAETEDQTRIYAASEYEVHHKIGDLYVGKILYTHDTAIVMAPIPYTISIMVEGVDYETNEQIIEDVIYIIEG
jgi:hypothetical protein